MGPYRPFSWVSCVRKYENGAAIVHPGEVHCRHEKCNYRKNKNAQEARNLRGHISRHDDGNFAVRAELTGRLTINEQEAAMAWYDSLFTTVAGPASPVTVPTAATTPWARAPPPPLP